MLPSRPPASPLPPVPVSLPKLLLVEGDTPMHFFEALLRHLKLDKEIEIRNFRGVGDFKTFIIGLANSADFQRVVTSVGVVRDAEDKPASAAHASVTYALTAAGLTSARTPPVQTSIFILPDNTNPGMLETLCMAAVKNEPSLAGAHACVEAFFTCLAHGGVALAGGPSLAKHQAQAYLASRPKPQMFPGTAAYQHYWPWDNPAFDPLKDFLRAL